MKTPSTCGEMTAIKVCVGGVWGVGEWVCWGGVGEGAAPLLVSAVMAVVLSLADGRRWPAAARGCGCSIGLPCWPALPGIFTILGVAPLSCADATSEKVTRGTLLSAIDRCLSRRRTVILDTHNGIKGYRYQLWCIARTVRQVAAGGSGLGKAAGRGSMQAGTSKCRRGLDRLRLMIWDAACLQLLLLAAADCAPTSLGRYRPAHGTAWCTWTPPKTPAASGMRCAQKTAAIARQFSRTWRAGGVW